MLRDKSWATVVADFDHQGTARVSQIARDELRPPSCCVCVSAFNCLPMLMQAVVRRFVCIMVSLRFRTPQSPQAQGSNVAIKYLLRAEKGVSIRLL